MRNNIVTISDNGVVSMPTAPIRMRDFEIAELLGVFNQTIRANIRSLIKSGIVVPDSEGTILDVSIFVPEFYGLEMVIALAFRANTFRSSRVRNYIMVKIQRQQRSSVPIYINCTAGALNVS